MPFRILVLGGLPLENDRARVGIQEIALGLAGRGHVVDYVTNPASLLDAYYRSRRPQVLRAWRERADERPRVFAENLRQFTFRTLFPREKRFWKSSLQVPAYAMMAPGWMRRERYDFCLHDTSFSALFARHVRARAHVYRLNDHPEAFADHVSPFVIDFFRRRIREGACAEIWAVSRPLVGYARELNGAVPVIHLPNGVDVAPGASRPRGPVRRRAAYVGSFEELFDFDLLERVAALLPGWSFDLYGSGSFLARNPPRAANIRVHGGVPHTSLPALLAECDVGLIPFRNLDRLRMVERPLKFYNYLAAGLGIASTGHGALRGGMEGFARFGDTPEEFAAAIVAAADPARRPSPEAVEGVFRESSWKALVAVAEDRLQVLAGGFGS